jgi:hypothetical protein
VLLIQKEPLSKILAHLKGSEYEIVFKKFHLLQYFLNEYIYVSIYLIILDLSFKKAISDSEPLKLAGFLFYKR